MLIISIRIINNVIQSIDTIDNVINVTNIISSHIGYCLLSIAYCLLSAAYYPDTKVFLKKCFMRRHMFSTYLNSMMAKQSCRAH